MVSDSHAFQPFADSLNHAGAFVTQHHRATGA
jgi:hypothetical protein